MRVYGLRCDILLQVGGADHSVAPVFENPSQVKPIIPVPDLMHRSAPILARPPDPAANSGMVWLVQCFLTPQLLTNPLDPVLHNNPAGHRHLPLLLRLNAQRCQNKSSILLHYRVSINMRGIDGCGGYRAHWFCWGGADVF